MRLKIKPPKTRIVDNKIYLDEMVFRLRDDFGDVVREQYHPFSNAKKEKKTTLVGTVEDAPF